MADYYYIDEKSRGDLLEAIAASKRPRVTSDLRQGQLNARFVSSGVRFMGFVKLTEWYPSESGYRWKYAKGSAPFTVDGVEQSDELGLAYSLDGAESRATGSTVALFRSYTDGGTPVNIFIPPASDVAVEITGAAPGGGKYYGKVFRPLILPPFTDVPATGNLSESEVGPVPASDDCLILNLMEVGQSTHDLTHAANTYQFYFLGRIVRVNSDGKKVVAINGFFMGC